MSQLLYRFATETNHLMNRDKYEGASLAKGSSGRFSTYPVNKLAPEKVDYKREGRTTKAKDFISLYHVYVTQTEGTDYQAKVVLMFFRNNTPLKPNRETRTRKAHGLSRQRAYEVML